MFVTNVKRNTQVYKVCTTCKKELPKDEFLYLGNSARHSKCHLCRREYQKKYYQKQKERSQKLW